jgi:pyrroline-5-carboxylate reductase
MALAGVAPVVIVGAGRMGGAIATGLVKADALGPDDLAFRAPRPRDAAAALIARGARDNPERVAAFPTVVLAVKPQVWREVAAELAPQLSPGAVVVSVVAGVRLADLEAAFQGRRCVRVMPTTGVAAADGVATVYAADAEARARGLALFEPIATTVALDEEDQMDAATAVSGSAPAYLYAFMEALEAAGARAGLSPAAAARLVRATLASASVLLRETGEEPAELRRQVTSPKGVTHAALQVLMDEATGFPALAEKAVQAAIARSRELGG